MHMTRQTDPSTLDKSETIDPQYTPQQIANGDAAEETVAAHLLERGASELALQLCTLVSEIRRGHDVAAELDSFMRRLERQGHHDAAVALFPTWLAIR